MPGTINMVEREVFDKIFQLKDLAIVEQFKTDFGGARKKLGHPLYRKSSIKYSVHHRVLHHPDHATIEFLFSTLN